MKLTGKCKKLRVYVDEDLKQGKVRLYHAILEILLKEGIAGATVYKGIEGYGSHHLIHNVRIIERTERLPMVVEAIEKPKKLLKALSLIEGILPPHCLVTLQDEEMIYHRLSKSKTPESKNKKEPS